MKSRSILSIAVLFATALSMMPPDAGATGPDIPQPAETHLSASLAPTFVIEAEPDGLGLLGYLPEHEAGAWLTCEAQPMHYRNGREAKNGDKIVQIQEGRIEAVGVLHSAVPGNDFCNGYIAPTQHPVATACLCDCLHVDDLAAILAEKGLDKRPATS